MRPGEMLGPSEPALTVMMPTRRPAGSMRWHQGDEQQAGGEDGDRDGGRQLALVFHEEAAVRRHRAHALALERAGALHEGRQQALAPRRTTRSGPAPATR